MYVYNYIPFCIQLYIIIIIINEHTSKGAEETYTE